MTEREIFKNYDNLGESELNKKDNKKVYVRNDVITTVIVHCRCKRKKRKKNIWIQKKVKFPEFAIWQCAEYKIKSKIGKIFVNKKIHEEYCIKIYEIDSYFKSW